MSSDAMGKFFHTDTSQVPADRLFAGLVEDFTCRSEEDIRSFEATQVLPKSYGDMRRDALRTELRERDFKYTQRTLMAALLASLYEYDARQPPKIMVTYHRLGTFRFMDLPVEIRH